MGIFCKQFFLVKMFFGLNLSLKIILMYIVPQLSDGLGNRLFQFAAAYAYAKRSSKTILFVKSRCKETNHGDFDNIFRLFPEIKVKEDLMIETEVEEPKNFYVYEEIKNRSNSSVLIKGYRQAYDYFKDVEIKPNFENIISKDRLLYLNDRYLKDKEDLYFVHIRLGDYLILPHHQINVGKYYSEALKLLPENSKLLFFSDDIEFAKQIFPYQTNFCMEKDEIENLYVMSNCLAGAIVGNSTFSYWGSYFAYCKNREKYKAIFPKPLGQGMPYPQDYYPPYALIISAL
jgi:hypothetical protein